MPPHHSFQFEVTIALVVLLRGVNVGGHRIFRPSQLPALLPELGLLNIGAAGTFVVQRRIGRKALLAALRRHLPFEADIVICDGKQIQQLVAANPFAEYQLGPDTVGFVSTLGRKPETEPILPVEFRDGSRWLVRLIGRSDCFVLGVYRRDPKTIGLLGKADRVFNVPITTRNWNTVSAIAAALETGK